MNFSGKFGSASTIWYPGSGYRDYGLGNLILCSVGNYWSASLYGNDAYNLYIRSDGGVNPSFNFYRADGNAVRCVRE